MKPTVGTHDNSRRILFDLGALPFVFLFNFGKGRHLRLNSNAADIGLPVPLDGLSHLSALGVGIPGRY